MMEASKLENTLSLQTDPIKCHVFLPEAMWGDTFNAIFPITNRKEFEVKPFPIGQTRNTNHVVGEAINRARTSMKIGITPIFVFPIGTVPQYILQEEYEKGKDEEGLKIVAPAFKTRDDIFLILRSGKEIPKGTPKGTTGIISKAEDITTSLVTRIYCRELTKSYIDPIFDHKHDKSFDFPYEFMIDNVAPGQDSDEAIKESKWHCKIAAGPELSDYLNKPDEWLAVVNLNSWICRRQKLSYFTRALFCSLSEAFGDKKHLDNLVWFWNGFVDAGCMWLKTVKDLCSKADRACVAGKTKTPFPTQSPPITCTKNQVTEIAHSIWSGVDFVRLAIKHELLIDCFPLKYTDFYVTTDSVLWEIYRLHHLDNLKNKIFEKCLKETGFISKKIADNDRLWKDTSAGIDRFLRGDFEFQIGPVNANISSVLVEKFISNCQADNDRDLIKKITTNKQKLQNAFESVIKELKDDKL